MKPARPTILALMILVATCGGLLAWIRSFAPFVVMPAVLATQTMVGWILALIVGWGLSQALGWHVQTPRRRADLVLALGLTLVLTSYLAWSFDRCEAFSSLLEDRGFPYPDRWISACERWLDAARPLPAGSDSLKIHGEYPLITLVLGVIVFGGMATLGLMLGALVGRRARSIAD